MTQLELLSIGRFSRLSGLSIGALRHYDEVGLLRPAEVDTFTGYRRYRPDQLDRARTVARLRGLELSLEQVRQIVDAPDSGAARAVLEAHRSAIEARTWQLQRIGHWLRQLIDHQEAIPVTDLVRPPSVDLDRATQRQLAVDLFNFTWTLLEKPDRSIEDDDRMLHAAHASRYHWGEIGEPVNRARGEWQVSRVYAVLRRAEPALHHARRCLELCQEHAIGDFDLAYAHEALARGYQVAGDAEAMRRHIDAANAAAQAISDPEDRELFASDMAGLAEGPVPAGRP